MIREAKKDRLWGRAYILLSLTNFFSWLSYNMITPIMTGYMETLGAGVSVCGIAGGMFAFVSCLSRPVSGYLSDCLNRKSLMGGFTVVMAAAVFAYFAVPVVPAILFFRAVHGMAFAVSSTASLVVVSECVPESRMAEGVSYYSIMSVVSMAAGPSLGIWVSGKYGYQVCMLAAAVILLAAGGMNFMIPYNAQAIQTQKNKIRNGIFSLVEPKLIGLTAVNAGFTMVQGVVSAFLLPMALEKGIGGAGLHFILSAVVLVVARILMAEQMNRMTLAQSLYPAFASGVMTLLLLGKADAQWFLIAAAVTKAFSHGMSQPALQTEAIRMVPAEKRGVACSTMYIGGDLGQALGPMAGGVVAQAAGYSNMYLWCILPLSAAWVYFIKREKQKSKNNAKFLYSQKSNHDRPVR